MKIVIDINDDLYNQILANNEHLYGYPELTEAIKNAELEDEHDQELIKDTVDSIWGKPYVDCVSREQAIDVVHKYFEHYLKVNDDICLDGIRSLPSVMPISGEDMRDATPEERESTQAYIDSISSPTGVQFDDYISRQQALEAVEEQKKGFYGVERYAIDECHSAIIRLPSVRTQPKRGKWIYTGDYFNDGLCKCSECEVEVDPSEARKFCFECGSYNGGDEDETN